MFLPTHTHEHTHVNTYNRRKTHCSNHRQRFKCVAYVRDANTLGVCSPPSTPPPKLLPTFSVIQICNHGAMPIVSKEEHVGKKETFIVLVPESTNSRRSSVNCLHFSSCCYTYYLLFLHNKRKPSKCANRRWICHIAPLL